MDVVFTRLNHYYRKREALHDVTVAFTPGITGLLGPNGAGKSTLLGLASTVLRPQQGTVQIGAWDLSDRRQRMSARERLGFLPQRFTVVPSMRAGEVTSYTAWVQGVPRSESPRAGQEALEALGLSELRHARVRSLSGGQRQRLGIAAALSHRPDVLLLDEATVALDPVARVEFRQYLKDISDQRTVLLSTHLVEDVIHLCDRVVVLDRGRIVFQGTTSEFAEVGSRADGEPTSALASPAEESYARLLRRGNAS